MSKLHLIFKKNNNSYICSVKRITKSILLLKYIIILCNNGEMSYICYVNFDLNYFCLRRVRKIVLGLCI